MRFRGTGGRCDYSWLAMLTATAVLACGAAQPDAPAAAMSGAAEPAVWVPKEFNLTYQGFTTHYTCDGLHDKMTRILLMLGARKDLQVRSWGCLRLAPDVFPGVSVKMNVLEPQGGQGGQGRQSAQTVPAHWQQVDLLAGRDPIDASADCDLIAQVQQKVLPLFATRGVDFQATCERRQLVVGGTRLKAKVLLADPVAAAAASPR
jgi:hypothetical protein